MEHCYYSKRDWSYSVRWFVLAYCGWFCESGIKDRWKWGAFWTAASSGASNVNGLSDALIEDNSLYLGQDPSSTTSTAEYNLSLGATALDAVTTGMGILLLGLMPLTANTSGEGNVAIGYNTLAANTTASQNLAMGYNALAIQTTDGEYNTAVGLYSRCNTIGDRNVALGYVALTANSEGSKNRYWN